jgi:hypothetical protein
MRILSAFLFVALIFRLIGAPLRADTVNTRDCSPAIVHSTVNGSVSVNCSIDTADIVTLIQSVQAIEKQQHLDGAQTHRLYEAINILLEALLYRDNRLTADVSKANAGIGHIAQMLTDIQMSPSGAVTNSGAVTSTGQNGGVIAGTIGVLNQNTSPDRTQFTTPLTAFYTQGVGIRGAMLSANSDSEIEDAAKHAADWLNSTNTWLFKYMGPAAQARFVDSTNALSFSYGSSAQASAANLQTRTNWLNTFNALIPNLKALIASHDYDPPNK